MSHIQRFVDPQNVNTILFDCHDATGATNPGGLKTQVMEDGYDSGEVVRDVEIFNPSAGGPARKASRKLRPREKRWIQHVKADTFSHLRQGLAMLSRILDEGEAVLEQTVEGQSVTAYIDVIDGDIPQVFRGQDQAGLEGIGLLELDIPIRCTVQAVARGAGLDPALNVLGLNATLLRDSDATDKVPDGGWTWTASTNITGGTVDATKEAFTWVMTDTVARDLYTASYPANPDEVWACQLVGMVANNGQLRVRIQFLDAVDAILQTTNSAFSQPSKLDDEAPVTLVATAPASTAKVRMLIGGLNASGSTGTYWVRNAMLEKSPAPSLFRVGQGTLPMDPALAGARTIPIWNPGHAPAPFVLECKGDTGAAMVQVLAGLRTRGASPGDSLLCVYANKLYYAQAEASSNDWLVTLGTETTLPGNDGSASGSGSNYARAAHTTDPNLWGKRITHDYQGSYADFTALRGAFDVYARVRAGAARLFELQLRYGPGSSDPPPYSLPPVAHDVSAASSFDWSLVKLGTIRVPREQSVFLGSLVLQLYTRIASGAAAALDVDHYMFVSQDDQSIVTVPPGATESWLGRELVTPTNPTGLTAGDINPSYPDYLRLNAATEAGGTPPVAGLAWPVGRHRVTFTFDFATGGVTGITLRVRNITDSTNATSLALSKNGGVIERALEFDSAAGKSYEPQVEMASGIGGYIRGITHEFIPAVASGQIIRSDPGSVPWRYAAEKLETGGELLAVLSGAPLPFEAPPGLSILLLDIGDAAPGGYLEPKSTLGRTPTIKATCYPRWWLP